LNRGRDEWIKAKTKQTNGSIKKSKDKRRKGGGIMARAKQIKGWVDKNSMQENIFPKITKIWFFNQLYSYYFNY
jgi:hypothetical protein